MHYSFHGQTDHGTGSKKKRVEAAARNFKGAEKIVKPILSLVFILFFFSWCYFEKLRRKNEY